ncbi:D-alanyl-D-alanine carboxypeptidase family protein [Streptomyces sp. NPDC090053]|uniref:D-alanyl-D-alanine carboxypeptidase family protein n=1 Tax=Streptomyces sp. NPDC090053 TaxID=3365932 RepID=UPI00381CAE29
MTSNASHSRRAVLGLAAAAVPAALLVSGATPASAATVIGGERLGLDGIQVRRRAGAPALPRAAAQSWLVADYDSGEVLAGYRPHRPLPPASTLKMLFADTVLPKFDKAQKHKVTAADLAGIPAGSSLVGVEAGTTYTVDQLWQGVFLRSGNDAVHVLSSMNGGVAGTVGEMAAKAVDLQALDTHVVSPDGYDHPGQLSSAYDLSLFARHGLRNTDFRGYCATRVAEFPGRGGKKFQIQNTDRLLGTYAGMIGVKNGYTTHAGNTFTGAATREGRTLLVTVMHPAVGYDAVYKETSALLDWGFRAVDKVTPVGTLVDPLSEGGGLRTASPAAGPRAARAAVSGGSGTGDSSSWPLLGAGGGVAALLAVGTVALRNRRPRRRRKH